MYPAEVQLQKDLELRQSICSHDAQLPGTPCIRCGKLMPGEPVAQSSPQVSAPVVQPTVEDAAPVAADPVTASSSSEPAPAEEDETSAPADGSTTHPSTSPDPVRPAKRKWF